jgi:outer membrane lipoprotein carrier protein
MNSTFRQGKKSQIKQLKPGKYLIAGIAFSAVFFNMIQANELHQASTTTEQSSEAVESISSKALLQKKLEDYAGYQASFLQTVNDSEGQVIHESTGQLEFKQPGMFRWQVLEPEEELLLSNGVAVWWYNPFVEQVTIYDAGQAMEKTPFALLVSRDQKVWDQFEISAGSVASSFEIIPKDLSNAQVIKLEVIFDKSHLQQILITSRSRQVSIYQLSDQKRVSPKAADFEFAIPTGIDVDDQRESKPVVEGNVSY